VTTAAPRKDRDRDPLRAHVAANYPKVGVRDDTAIDIGGTTVVVSVRIVGGYHPSHDGDVDRFARPEFYFSATGKYTFDPGRPSRVRLERSELDL
jgi:hypothetical protein